ncbi:MAG: DNA gyrase inhibitor YacG [Bdellovibrionales bacterium]
MICVHCPICHQIMQAQEVSQLLYFPFCSKRCRLIDLGRWLKEEYTLPAEEQESDYPHEPGDTNYPP